MRMSLMTAVSLCAALLVGTKLSAQRPATGSRTGIAVADMGSITQKSARLKKSMDDLKAEYENEAVNLRKESEDGNKRAAEFQKMPPNDPKRKKAEEDLHRLRTQFELHGKRINDRIRESEVKIFANLQREVKEELAQYAEANGVQLILRYDPTPAELTDPRAILQEIHKPIVYQAGNDITPVVIDSLNRRAPAANTAARPAAPANTANRPAAPTRTAPR